MKIICIYYECDASNLYQVSFGNIVKISMFEVFICFLIYNYDLIACNMFVLSSVVLIFVAND